MIVEIERSNDMVVQQVFKPDGSLVRTQYGRIGDATSFKMAASIEAARKEIAPLVGKTVDRNGDVLIQKVTKNGEPVGYRHGSDELGWINVKTLAEARKAIGKDPVKKACEK